MVKKYINNVGQVSTHDNFAFEAMSTGYSSVFVAYKLRW